MSIYIYAYNHIKVHAHTPVSCLPTLLSFSSTTPHRLLIFIYRSYRPSILQDRLGTTTSRPASVRDVPNNQHDSYDSSYWDNDAYRDANGHHSISVRLATHIGRCCLIGTIGSFLYGPGR